MWRINLRKYKTFTMGEKKKDFIQSTEDVTPRLWENVMDSLCKIFLSQEEI